MKLKKLTREDFEGEKSTNEKTEMTDFDEIVEASGSRKPKLPGLKLVEWSKDEISHFEMFEKYLNHRGKRIWFVLQIFSTRLLCIGLTTLASTIMYSYFIEDAISDDGRNLGVAFQCKLPPQYWETEGREQRNGSSQITQPVRIGPSDQLVCPGRIPWSWIPDERKFYKENC